MADGSPLEQYPSTIGLSETAEKQRREGLSLNDRGLPVRQNIIRVYNHTPELQEIGRVLQSRDEEEMKNVFRKSSDQVEHFYGITVDVISDEELLKLTRNPKNTATLRGSTIFMAKSTAGNATDSLRELGHELGAFRLLQIYGSIDKIPVLPPQRGETLLSTATHYLDEFVLDNGNPACLEGLRKL